MEARKMMNILWINLVNLKMYNLNSKQMNHCLKFSHSVAFFFCHFPIPRY